MNISKKAFALPTVLIVSIIMLSVLVSAISSTSAVRVALRDQHYNHLSQQASNAGIAYAKACMAINGGIPQWTDIKPLKPNTDCYGDQIAGFTCDANSTDSRCSLLVEGDNVLVSFSVPLPAQDSTGAYNNISVNSSVNLLRKSNNEVWRSYNHDVKNVKVVSVARWKQLSALYSNTCGINFNDKAYCWGANGSGQVGDSTSVTKTTPAPILDTGVLAGLTIDAVSTGSTHACAIASNKKPYCWGANNYSQLGDGTTVAKTTPNTVTNTGAIAGLDIVSITANQYNTCALASNETLYCWGYNLNGQLGIGNTTTKNVPTLVPATGILAGLTIKSFSLGAAHVCAIASNYSAYCWGSNFYGQVGNGSTAFTVSSPVAVVKTGALSGLTIKMIASGSSHTCAIASNDKVYCWGNNASGQLGDGTTTRRTSPILVSGVLAGLTINSISVGNDATCVIASDGKAYCWGANTYSQIDTTTSNKTTPTEINTTGALTGLTFKSLVAGNYHTCAITSDDQSYCWGRNNSGQLGDGRMPTNYNVLNSLPIGKSTIWYSY